MERKQIIQSKIHIWLIQLCFLSFLFLWQGVLMIQDQYRAIMQYSVSKETTTHDKVLTDWYCAKVSQMKLITYDLSEQQT